MDIASFAASELPRLTDLRHRLHQIPELGYEEFKTAQLIRAELDRLGITYLAGVADAPTATIATIGDPRKPCIALRADIDALPITEATAKPYASTHPGHMHACGHDGHAAMLLGTAAALLTFQDSLSVCVKLMFQPAEEGGGGAGRLVNAGVLDGRVGPKVSAVFGLHGWPGLKVGQLSTRPGPLMAATDTFLATFHGRGAHGAYPHTGRDPIVAASEAVLSLQQVVSREVSPVECAVVTVGTFAAGTATNIIPATATISGTLRSLSDETRTILCDSVKRRCQGVAAANDCALDYIHKPGYPVTINDPATAAYVADTLTTTFGPRNFIPTPWPSMGGEDFAFYLQETPGCFFYLGLENEGSEPCPNLHGDTFDFNDAAIPVGIRAFCAIVRGYDKVTR